MKRLRMRNWPTAALVVFLIGSLVVTAISALVLINLLSA